MIVHDELFFIHNAVRFQEVCGCLCEVFISVNCVCFYVPRCALPDSLPVLRGLFSGLCPADFRYPASLVEYCLRYLCFKWLYFKLCELWNRGTIKGW
jgi:hypothetical protein